MNRARAFTLIELLVVISIIALLIAIPLPVLKNAQYQAQLVKCKAVLRGVATAQLSYAIDNKNFFPAGRPRYEGTGSWFAASGAGAQVRSWQLYEGGINGYDLRPAYYDYLDSDIDKGMECPLASDFYVNSDDATLITYMLYTTNNYRNKTFNFAKIGAYEKLGDTWASRAFPNMPMTLLASDFVYGKYNGSPLTTHVAPSGANGQAGNGTNDAVGWQLGDNEAPVNYADADGSVQTYTIRRESYLDTDNWLPNFYGSDGGFGFMVPRDLVK